MEHNYSSYKKIQKRRHSLSILGAFEGLFYELKPIGYLLFTIVIFNSEWVHKLPIKFSTVGIAFFALYVIYSRLVSRGYI